MQYLITAGPPTPNGDLHLGHLSGPYLSADILSRYLRMTGERVTYISASDDHQSYVARAAAQQSRDPASVAAENSRRIHDTLESAGIALDLFASPAQSPRYTAFIQEVFRALLDRGALEERTTEQPFCAECDRFAFEAHLRGRCAHCDADSDGGICEACGKPNAGGDLRDPICIACGNTPETRPLRQLWFPLDRYRSAAEFTFACAWLSPRARALVAEILAGVLPDVPATQPAEWGIKVPAEGYEDQRISAWFELGPHYLAITDLLSTPARDRADWRDLWSGLGTVIQCFGFDSIYFHIILFPAIFQAFDPRLRPPAGFLANEFLRLDGRKFSTSRGHALWGGEFLRDHDADALRFHLARISPEIEQTNFTMAQFEATQRELVERWDSWLIHLAERCIAAGGTVPLAQPSRSGPVALSRLAGLLADLSSCYALMGFSPSRAAHLLDEIVGLARRFREEHAVLDDKPASVIDAAAALVTELTIARGLALAAAPIMPHFAERLWRDLGERGPVSQARWEALPVAPTAGERITLSQGGYFRLPPEPAVLELEAPVAPIASAQGEEAEIVPKTSRRRGR